MNKTGYETIDEVSEDKKQRIDVKVKPASDWNVVKEWQGRADQ